MNTLGIDIETYSSVSLKQSGMYKYVQSPDFTILLISYQFNNDEIVTIDLAERGDGIDWALKKFLMLLVDPDVLKTAHNAAFEITCLSRYFRIPLYADEWEDTAIRVTMLGYPLSLDEATKAMGTEVKKDARGKALIKLFSVPVKGTGERVMPSEYPAKWQQYIQYNQQDVVAEQGLREATEWFVIPEMERRLWILDQKINERGIKLDMQLVKQTLRVHKQLESKLMEEARELTGLANPNSIQQLSRWFDERLGQPVGKLTKDNIKNWLEDDLDDTTKRVFEIRQELAKASIKKYVAMYYCAGTDHRARGLLQLYGANKTGRWAGRLIQVQNLPQNKLPDIGVARDCVKAGNLDVLELMYGNVSDTLSQLIRTAFVGDDGKLLAVTDFSAIEARVIAWFAQEAWRLEVFKTHGKIYEASASQMFSVPLEKVDKALRQKGKIAELALGYQGSVGAMEKMGALKMGLKEEDLMPIVQAWRKANPNIVRLWYSVQKAAIQAIENPGTVVRIRYLAFQVKRDILFIKLPSGRLLTYINPRLKEGKYGTVIKFMGVDQIKRRWTWLETYGGKLVENIVQGTARDLLADAMLRLDDQGRDIVMHVHDEIVLEVDEDTAEDDLQAINDEMGKEVSWAPGLPLGAASFLTPFYIKD